MISINIVMDLIKKRLKLWNISPEEKKLIEDAANLKMLVNIEQKIFDKQINKKKIALPLYLKIIKDRSADEDTELSNENKVDSADEANDQNSDEDEYEDDSMNSNYGLTSKSRSSGYKSNGFILYKL